MDRKGIARVMKGQILIRQHLWFIAKRKMPAWNTWVKMPPIFRDIMIGIGKLAENGVQGRVNGHNAIAAGFQGQRQWTDYKHGVIFQKLSDTSFDWNE